MHRLVTSRRAAVLAGGLLGIGLFAGCSAGQIAETATIVPSVPGPNADVLVPGRDGGLISIRDVTVDYPGVNGYAAGDTVPLTVRIFNQTTQTVTLRAVTASLVSGSGQATSAGPVATAGAAQATACTGTPSTTPAPIASPATPSAEPTGSAISSVSTAPSGEPTAAPSAPPTAPSASSSGSGSVSVAIPPSGCVILSQAQGRYLAVTGLTSALRLGSTVNLVFDFSLADGGTARLGTTQPATNPSATPLPINAPIAPPTQPAPRTSLSFGSPPQE